MTPLVLLLLLVLRGKRSLATWLLDLDLSEGNLCFEVGEKSIQNVLLFLFYLFYFNLLHLQYLRKKFSLFKNYIISNELD